MKLSPRPSTHRNPVYCVLLNCVFDYQASTTQLPPSSNFFKDPSLSFSCPPGNLWGGGLGEFGDWPRNPGEGRGIGEVFRGVGVTENHNPPPPQPIGGNPWRNFARTPPQLTSSTKGGGVIPGKSLAHPGSIGEGVC